MTYNVFGGTLNLAQSIKMVKNWLRLSGCWSSVCTRMS